MARRRDDKMLYQLTCWPYRDAWYELAQDGKKWYHVCVDGIQAVMEQCSRSVGIASLA